MKKLILSIIAIFLASNMFAQEQKQEVNTFQKSENAATGTTNAATNGGAIGSVGAEQVQGAGNPPGDKEIPIDNYLPALVIIGATLIIYQLKSKKIKTL